MQQHGKVPLGSSEAERAEQANAQWRKREDLASIAYKLTIDQSVAQYFERHLSPPPALPPFLFSPVGRAAGKAFIGALQIYFGFVGQGEIPSDWLPFRSQLASKFGHLVLALADSSREAERLDLLSLFLRSLDLRGRSGRPRKAQEKLQAIQHGLRMGELWDKELFPAWNMKRSLEEQREDPRMRLKRSFPSEIAEAVLAKMATPESSLARLYASRNQSFTYGAARNALRFYQKRTQRKFTPSL